MKTISSEYIPPFSMRKFIEALISEEVKGNKTEAERRTGVKRERFYYYFNRYPEFRKWFSNQCDKVLGKNEAIPPYALMSAIIKGDVQAIRTYYELIGKLKHQITDMKQETHLHFTNIKQVIENAAKNNGKLIGAAGRI